MVMMAAREDPDMVCSVHWDEVGDVEIAFEVLSRAYSLQKWHHMFDIPNVLFDNKQFMMRVLEKRPFAYWQSSGALVLDKGIQDILLEITGSATGSRYVDQKDPLCHKRQRAGRLTSLTTFSI